MGEEIMGRYVVFNPPLLKCNNNKQLTGPGPIDSMRTNPNLGNLTAKGRRKTKACGNSNDRTGVQIKKKARRVDARQGQYLCPICSTPYVQQSYLFSHFPKCAETYGNEKGYNWDDDPSIPWMEQGMDEFGRLTTT